MNPTHKRVRFQGKEYWLNDDLLSPIEHFAEDGTLLVNPFRDVSYAIVTEDGEIMRYMQVIGYFSELEFIEVPGAHGEGPLCSDCPPVGYPTDSTRCHGCPRVATDPAAAKALL